MAPPNAARRAALADAAIEVLAAGGARELTHRAVDAAAGEPPGTCSRYFRTRDALLVGVVERVREVHFGRVDPRDLERVGAIDPEVLPDALAGAVRDAVTTDRARNLALVELQLESTRRPGLREAVGASSRALVDLTAALHEAAGVPLPPERAALLAAAMHGVALTAMTTPDALPGGPEAAVRDLVRALRPPAARPGR